MEQKQTQSPTKSTPELLKNLVLPSLNTHVNGEDLQDTFSRMLESELRLPPPEPLRIGESDVVFRTCGSERISPQKRRCTVSTQTVAASSVRNSDDDVFQVIVSAHSTICDEFEFPLQKNSIYQIDWYFEIYHRKKDMSLGKRQYFKLLRRHFPKFGTETASQTGNLDGHVQMSSLMKDITGHAFTEIRAKIDEISLGDYLSPKKADAILTRYKRFHQDCSGETI